RAATIALLLMVAALPRPASAAERASPTPAATAPIELIDHQISEGWKANKLTPSNKAEDGEWCRRLYLDILGRVPSVAELDAFFRDPAAKRRENVVARLLGPQYVEEYARNWSTLWTNILIGRAGGTDPQSPVDRDGL